MTHTLSTFMMTFESTLSLNTLNHQGVPLSALHGIQKPGKNEESRLVTWEIHQEQETYTTEVGPPVDS